MGTAIETVACEYTRPIELDQPEISRPICSLKVARGLEDTFCDFSRHRAEQGTGWIGYDPEGARNCERRKRASLGLRVYRLGSLVETTS